MQREGNKYMEDLFNLIEEISYLPYLDPNNMYGWRINQPLPTEGFNWEKDIERFTTKKIANWVRKNGRKSYLLEVDLEYPKELHKMHNDFPFIPEKIKINNVEKLVPNLCGKETICETHQSTRSGAKT